MSASALSVSSSHRRGVSRTRPIEAAKEAVSVLDFAKHLCGASLRRVGNEYVACCPLRDHEDKTPSFTVNDEKNLFFCHGCLRGGDVVELARFAWGYEKHEVAMAAADLLHEFGHDIPARPASWYRKQVRQQPVRDALDEVRVNSLRRRLFRLFEPMISGIADDEKREREAEYIWREITPLAVAMIEEWRLEREQGRQHDAA